MQESGRPERAAALRGQNRDAEAEGRGTRECAVGQELTPAVPGGRARGGLHVALQPLAEGVTLEGHGLQDGGAAHRLETHVVGHRPLDRLVVRARVRGEPDTAVVGLGAQLVGDTEGVLGELEHRGVVVVLVVAQVGRGEVHRVLHRLTGTTAGDLAALGGHHSAVAATLLVPELKLQSCLSLRHPLDVIQGSDWHLVDGHQRAADERTHTAALRGALDFLELRVRGGHEHNAHTLGRLLAQLNNITVVIVTVAVVLLTVRRGRETEATSRVLLDLLELLLLGVRPVPGFQPRGQSSRRRRQPRSVRARGGELRAVLVTLLLQTRKTVLARRPLRLQLLPLLRLRHAEAQQLVGRRRGDTLRKLQTELRSDKLDVEEVDHLHERVHQPLPNDLVVAVRRQLQLKDLLLVRVVRLDTLRHVLHDLLGGLLGVTVRHQRHGLRPLRRRALVLPAVVVALTLLEHTVPVLTAVLQGPQGGDVVVRHGVDHRTLLRHDTLHVLLRVLDLRGHGRLDLLGEELAQPPVAPDRGVRQLTQHVEHDLRQVPEEVLGELLVRRVPTPDDGAESLVAEEVRQRATGGLRHSGTRLLLEVILEHTGATLRQLERVLVQKHVDTSAQTQLRRLLSVGGVALLLVQLVQHLVVSVDDTPEDLLQLLSGTLQHHHRLRRSGAAAQLRQTGLSLRELLLQGDADTGQHLAHVVTLQLAQLPHQGRGAQRSGRHIVKLSHLLDQVSLAAVDLLVRDALVQLRQGAVPHGSQTELDAQTVPADLQHGVTQRLARLHQVKLRDASDSPLTEGVHLARQRQGLARLKVDVTGEDAEDQGLLLGDVPQEQVLHLGGDVLRLPRQRVVTDTGEVDQGQVRQALTLHPKAHGLVHDALRTTRKGDGGRVDRRAHGVERDLTLHGTFVAELRHSAGVSLLHRQHQRHTRAETVTTGERDGRETLEHTALPATLGADNGNLREGHTHCVSLKQPVEVLDKVQQRPDHCAVRLGHRELLRKFGIILGVHGRVHLLVVLRDVRHLGF
eukprot:Hpha_TRINITY_DN16351_c1_g2::TRINITY_DN16351_c1_g2_i10::g.62754::m.62754